MRESSPEAEIPWVLWPIHQLEPTTLRPLRDAGAREGFRFLERLQDDWLAGRNRFDDSLQTVGSTIPCTSSIRNGSSCSGFRRWRGNGWRVIRSSMILSSPGDPCRREVMRWNRTNAFN